MSFEVHDLLEMALLLVLLWDWKLHLPQSASRLYNEYSGQNNKNRCKQALF